MAKSVMVVPAYNEEANIGPLLHEIERLALRLPLSVILVDDGSVDETLPQAQRHRGTLDLQVIRHPVNLGVPQTFYDGLVTAAARSDDSDCIFILEGDGTSDLALVSEMVQRIEHDDEVVIASRYIRGGGFVNFPRHRTAGSHCINGVLRTIFHMRGVTDYTIFFRAYRAEVIKRALEKHGRGLITGRSFAANLELLLRVYPYCRHISEVPFRYDYGLKKSSSKMGILKTVKEYWGLIAKRLAGRI